MQVLRSLCSWWDYNTKVLLWLPANTREPKSLLAGYCFIGGGAATRQRRSYAGKVLLSALIFERFGHCLAQATSVWGIYSLGAAKRHMFTQDFSHRLACKDIARNRHTSVGNTDCFTI